MAEARPQRRPQNRHQTRARTGVRAVHVAGGQLHVDAKVLNGTAKVVLRGGSASAAALGRSLPVAHFFAEIGLFTAHTRSNIP
jgi:hypothetical protein